MNVVDRSEENHDVAVPRHLFDKWNLQAIPKLLSVQFQPIHFAKLITSNDDQLARFEKGKNTPLTTHLPLQQPCCHDENNEYIHCYALNLQTSSGDICSLELRGQLRENNGI